MGCRHYAFSPTPRELFTRCLECNALLDDLSDADAGRAPFAERSVTHRFSPPLSLSAVLPEWLEQV